MGSFQEALGRLPKSDSGPFKGIQGKSSPISRVYKGYVGNLTTYTPQVWLLCPSGLGADFRLGSDPKPHEKGYLRPIRYDLGFIPSI